jgi:hypothetical protein
VLGGRAGFGRWETLLRALRGCSVTD